MSSMFAAIHYNEVSVLLDIDTKTSIVPFFVERVHCFPLLPDYCRGVIEIQERICVVVNLACVLGISEEMALPEAERKLLTFDTGFGQLALLVPSPRMLTSSSDLEIVEGEEQQEEPEQTKRASTLDVDLVSEAKTWGRSVILDGSEFRQLSRGKLLSNIARAISRTLDKTWDRAKPRWIDLTAFLKKKPSLERVRVPRAISHEEPTTSLDSWLILGVGKHSIAVRETSVLSVLLDQQHTTPLPNAPSYVLGLFDHDMESILLIDLARLLEFPAPCKQDARILVVVESKASRIAVAVHSIVTDEFDETQVPRLFADDRPRSNMPFTNAIALQNDEIAFVLNIEEIANNVSTYRLTNSRQVWCSFLSGKRSKETEEHTSQTVEGTDLLCIRSEEPPILVPFDMLADIRVLQEVDRTSIEKLQLAEHDNKWVPSFSLDTILGGVDFQLGHETTAVVLKSDDDLHVEIRTNDLRVVTHWGSRMNEDTWNKMLCGRNTGLLPPVEVPGLGTAFPIDANGFARLCNDAVCRTMGSEETQMPVYDIPKLQHPPSATRGRISSLAQLPHEDSAIYLIVEEKDGNKWAFNAEEIDCIELKHGADAPFATGEHGMADDDTGEVEEPARITFSDGQTMQVPAWGFLAYLSESMKSVNEDSEEVILWEKEIVRIKQRDKRRRY